MAVNPRRSIGAPGNFAQSGYLGYAVGDPVFLNSAASKVKNYWRQIEYGNESMVGRYLGGLWTDQPGRGDLIGGNLTPFAGRRDQNFVPFYAHMMTPEDAILGAMRALGYLRLKRQISFIEYRVFRLALEQHGVEAAVPTLGQIKESITGQGAYRQAYDSFYPAQREMEAIQQALGSLTYFSASGHKRSVLSDRTGSGRVTKKASVPFTRRTGFIQGYALSQKNASLSKVDQTFRAELTKVNRSLALQLAEEVHRIQSEQTKRPAVQTRALEAATLSPENRFPS